MGHPTQNKAYRDKQSKSSKYKTSLIRQATRSEIIFKRLLDKLDIKYTFQRAFIKEGFYFVDFFIESMGLCIEIDGEYHNGYEQGIKDEKKELYIMTRGYRLLRMTNDYVSKLMPENLKSLFEDIITRKRVRIFRYE